LSEKLKPWVFINQIQNKTTKLKYDKKVCSGWQLSYFLSHSEYYMRIVGKMNKVQMYVPDKAVYDYYFDQIPGYERLNFSKQDKEMMDERQKKVDEIKEEYNVSNREGLLILIHKERL